MLIDMAQQYNEEKKTLLKDIRTKVIIHISAQHDHKKILTFLAKSGIINIEEQEKKIYIGFPNDFVLAQGKKIFNKSFKEAVQQVYNPQFTVEYRVYQPFSNGSDLLLDLKKLLNIKEEAASTRQSSEKNIKSELSDYFGILFDPSFRFDNFVAGANNQFAFSAAKAVAENPGTAYNPLFLYGNVGLGKTHLMQAIGNEIMQNDQHKVVIYLPATKLVEEIVQSLRHNKMNTLMRKFDDVDVLLIDDIQFLADKDKTQEVFHNIFNDFHSKKKQVIISSDRPPKELQHIEPRLKSRFALGLVADIHAPDFETRIAILESKLEVKQEHIDFELLSLVAQHIKSNVRELEGALNILLTRKKLSCQEITEEDVHACLQTLGYQSKTGTQSTNTSEQNSKSLQSFDTIVEMVANYYGISVADLKSDSRKKEITTARQILMLIAKKYFKRTLEKIGDYFGGKNHATAIYAIGNIEKKLKTDENIKHDYQIFIEWVEG
ncbi:MAG: chromosomal replication initiator protein DnaA [Candidatus Absconditabacteria bacterium]|nr:chromosomal replication initiator protein DnaA [Candidatus Absconditabacteria bacterium]MDD3868063.1 chromosomal replication initiator protein DnaA [Candidatus Absconditabacteria bacterium]MDD4714310.1 chromosomal replication initiator protein DnaA [Candidatus Absconditabacteria bacterium]